VDTRESAKCGGEEGEYQIFDVAQVACIIDNIQVPLCLLQVSVAGVFSDREIILSVRRLWEGFQKLCGGGGCLKIYKNFRGDSFSFASDAYISHYITYSLSKLYSPFSTCTCA